MPAEIATPRNSDAFRIEYDTGIKQSTLYKDIESYLGEYRFNIPKYNYQLRYSRGELCDVDEGIAMTDRCLKTLDQRMRENRSISRETAELQGMRKINTYIAGAQPDDMVVWLSPPGPKSDGYGDYGFCFVGQVKNTGSEKELQMTAVRVEQPTMNQCNQFLSRLHNQLVQFQTPEQLLANPTILRGINPRNFFGVLPEFFQFESDNRKEQIFQEVMRSLQPHISEFITMIKSGTATNDLERAFNAIEVLAETLRDNYDSFSSKSRVSLQNVSDLKMLVQAVGEKKAAEVNGSCGKSGNSANILNKYSSIRDLVNSFKDTSSDSMFECPNCHKESKPPVGNQCPQCKITLEEAREKGLVTCE